MSRDEPSGAAREDGCDTEVLRAERDDIARLLHVIESHLALGMDGERFDRRVLLDALDHLTEYVRHGPVRAASVGEARYRAMFEAATRRVGCGYDCDSDES